jgi:transketolase
VDTSATDTRVDLAERAYRIRRNALLMGEVQGQGYIGQALDIADVLAVAYFGAMRYRPDDPDWEGRDRFLLSNGHYAIALYAALIEAGIVPEDELETYGSDDSRCRCPAWRATRPAWRCRAARSARADDRGRRCLGPEAQGFGSLRLHAVLRWRAGRGRDLGGDSCPPATGSSTT